MRPSEALTLHRAALRQLLDRYGFREPRVFGSVLTRTDTEESDLDVLVEPVRGTTLFTLADLEDEARRLAGVRVSVLTPGFLSPKFRDKVFSRPSRCESPGASRGLPYDVLTVVRCRIAESRHEPLPLPQVGASSQKNPSLPPMHWLGRFAAQALPGHR